MGLFSAVLQVTDGNAAGRWATWPASRPAALQAPRTQELQAPRSADFKKASGLVSEAEAACKAGNASLATVKAKAAMELLK